MLLASFLLLHLVCWQIAHCAITTPTSNTIVTTTTRASHDKQCRVGGASTETGGGACGNLLGRLDGSHNEGGVANGGINDPIGCCKPGVFSTIYQCDTREISDQHCKCATAFPGWLMAPGRCGQCRKVTLCFCKLAAATFPHGASAGIL